MHLEINARLWKLAWFPIHHNLHSPRMFGAPVQFEDRDVDAAKDAYIECPSFEDNTFDLHRQEHDCATQVGFHSNSGWFPWHQSRGYKARGT